MKVADLFALLGIRMDKASFKRGTDAIDSVKSKILGLGTAIVAAFAGKAAYNSLIGFNATVEETKSQLAGMFALVNKTDLADQIANADMVFASLQKRANSLPGTTQEYAKFASLVARSVMSAGLSMKDLEDITVGAVVAAKAFGEQTEVAARDIDQFLGGRFGASDTFSKKLFGSLGYDSEQGREKVRRMSVAQRAELLKTALTQKQITQLAEAQGKTYAGILSTTKDAFEQLAGKIGKPLFERLKEGLTALNAWVDKNRAKIDAFANKVSKALVKAVDFVVLHWKMFGVIAASIVLAIIGPFLLLTAKIALVSYAILALAALFQRVWQRWGGDITAAANKVHNWAVIIRNRVDQVVGFFRDAGLAIRDSFTNAINFVAEKIEWVVNKLNQARSFARDAVGFVTDGVGGDGTIIQQARNAVRDVPSAHANRTVTNNVTFNATGTDPKQVMQEFQSNFDGFLRQTALAVQ